MNKNYMKELLKSTISHHKKLTLWMCITIILAISFALFPPLVLEKIVFFLSQKQQVPLILILLYFGCIACTRLLEAGQNSLITIFGQKITHGIRSMMNEKLNQLPASYFSKHESASITSRFVHDVDALDALFTNGIISMFADGFKIISILFVIFYKSKGLGTILVILLPLLFYLTRSFQKRMLKAQIQNRRAIAKVNAHIPETIKNSRMINNYACQSFMEKRYDTSIQESYHAIEKANLYDSLYSPIILIISSCVIALMMVMAASGEEMQMFFGISVASAVALVAYVNDIFTPLESIGMEIQNIQSAIAGVKRMNEFLNEKPRKGNDSCLNVESDECGLCFDHVTFGYDEKVVIKDLSFEVKPNERITFTGPSGAGKSTLFKLICGFYQPQSGHVYIHGMDAFRIQDQEKRKIFGYVKQSFDSVAGTIQDQITLYDETITDEQIQQVLQLVGLEETIASFPKGLQTTFHSSFFSQGQLQLLSLARSLVSNPSILLLDEISANLDSETERKIQEAIQKASQNRTVLSISHRLYEKNPQGRQINIK